eukprot:3969470-Karenia_brevis.AAC.1
MVSDGLDLGGRNSGVYGTCSSGPGWSGLRFYGVWVSVVTVSMVSDGLDLGGRGYGVSGVWTWVVGLRCLWCLCQCGRGYGVYGV